MKVIVVIPTQGHRPELIKEAIESIEGQTMPPDEMVVTCGHNPPTERLNLAIERSQCDAFVVLADDDKLDPQFIERTVDAMECKHVDIVYTNCHIFGLRNCPGAALGEWTRANIDNNTVPLCTSLCRKSAWERAGRYESVPFYDWDFWWRCFYAGATAYWLKEPLFWWRDHQAGETRNCDQSQSREFILNRHNELRLKLCSPAN